MGVGLPRRGRLIAFGRSGSVTIGTKSREDFMLGYDSVAIRKCAVACAAVFAIAAGGFLGLSASARQAGPRPNLRLGRLRDRRRPPLRVDRGPVRQVQVEGRVPPGQAGAGRGGPGAGVQGTQVFGPNGPGDSWGFSDSAFNPGTRWRIHDPERPSRRS